MAEKLNEILKHAKTKQIAMEQILGITREIEERFATNDSPGAQLALDMRMEEILIAQSCDEAIELILDAMPIEDVQRITKIIKLQTKDMELKPEETLLMNTYSSIKTAVDRAIEVDQRISTKIGGTASYYAQKEQ